MNVRRAWLAGVFACSLLSIARAAEPLDQWQVVATPGHSIRGLAYKDGTFVAVGFSTNTVVSTNGTNWVRGTNGLSGNNGLYAVAAGAGRFVAVGPNSVVLSSPDGVQWTRHSVHTNEEYWAVTYGGGQFVVVGFNSYGIVPEPSVALVSTNGLAWQRSAIPINTTARNVAYGNGVYVASGWPHSMYSTNGRQWIALTNVGASAVAFGQGKFVMAGTSTGYVSTNGVNWTTVTLPNEQYFTATYANGRFLFGNGEKPYGLIAASTNGLAWTSHTFTFSNNYAAIRDLVFVDGWLFAGDQLGGKIWRSGRLAPASLPQFSHIGHAAHETRISIKAVAGYHYTAERKVDVCRGEWADFGERVFAETDVLTVTDSNATNQTRFYRARVE